MCLVHAACPGCCYHRPNLLLNDSSALPCGSNAIAQKTTPCHQCDKRPMGQANPKGGLEIRALYLVVINL